jgi:hypothetical protein
MIITTEGTNPARYAGQSTPNNGYYATITLSIDELQFVDQDIADKFQGMSTPLECLCKFNSFARFKNF